MRPTDAPLRRDLLWRGAVVTTVVAAALLGAPDPLLRVGAVLGVALAAERLSRRRGRGPADAAVLTAGGLLGGLVLVGLVLDHTPWGYGTRAWTVGLGIGAFVALVVAGVKGRTRAVSGARTTTTSGSAATLRRGDLVRAVPWVAASLVVAALAIGISSRSADRAAQPGSTAAGFTMALGAVSGTDVDVVVTAPATAPDPGPFALRVMVGSTEITYPVFTPAAGQPHTSRVSVPATGQFEVDLVDPDGGGVVRSLVLAR